MQINNLYSNLQTHADYIPIYSTITSLVYLFKKYLISTAQQPHFEKDKPHCYTFLQQKSMSRCFIILSPVLGNITIVIYDFIKAKSQSVPQNAFSPKMPTSLLPYINQMPTYLIHHPNPQKNLNAQLQNLKLTYFNLDVETAIQIMSHDGLLLKCLTNKLKENEKAIEEFTKTPNLYSKLHAINLNLINQKIVLAAVQQNGLALQFAPDSLKDHVEVVKAAYCQNPQSSQFANPRLQAALKDYLENYS